MSEPDARRRYRDFVLRHHPDRRGDRAVFERGLAAHRAAAERERGAGGPAARGVPPGPGSPTIVAHRKAGARRALRRWWRRRRRHR